MSCCHDDSTGRHLGWGVALTIGFVAVEAVAGWRAGSLSLLSDAGHNLSDGAALAVSWYAVRVSRKPAHSKMTFGYHRVGIVADQSVRAGQTITRGVESALRRHRIHHTTVQIETDCRHESLFCQMNAGHSH